MLLVWKIMRIFERLNKRIMFRKLRNRIREVHLSLRTKLFLSFSSIAVVLLISSIISIMEYGRMSNYVSELIADDIYSINVSQKISTLLDGYNLQVLTAIGDSSVTRLPDFDQQRFVASCDSLKASIAGSKLLPLADSVLYSYQAYMLTSLELESVIQSTFINSRSWYFGRLQPTFNHLRSDIDKLNTGIYADLQAHSETFDRGFYRSIIPGAVALGVGIVLVLLLMFFIIAYYVNPVYKMLDGLDNYRDYNRKYTYTFDGDDQLSALNTHVSELIEENRQLRRKVREYKESEEG